MNLNEYVKKHYRGRDIIHGPNWVIIKPTQEELNIANKNALYHSKEKECILCHSKFSFGQTQKIICGECKLIAISEGSGEAFEFLWNCSGTKRKLIINSIIDNGELHLNNGYSDGNMSRHKIGDCPNCGAKNVKIYNSRCTYCSNKELNSPINCEKHGFQKNSFAGKCILCLNEQKDYKAQTKLRTKTILSNIERGILEKWPGGVKPNFMVKQNVKFYKGKELESLCQSLLDSSEDINKYPGFTIRRGHVCYNGVDVLSDEFIPNVGNFHVENNVKYYKNEPVTDIIFKLESKEYDINDFPGWNKRFGEWYYNTENILTGDVKILNNYLFEEKDGILYYLDREIKDYISWENYKKKFLKSKARNIDFQLPNKFQLVPTFRTQESENWEGTRAAFEQNLVDLRVGWFVYIKFYINENNIKPLVVGKSGSLLVNSNGSDVSFSKNIEDGPARRFLYESKLEWYKTEIAICKCDNEKEAYEIEKNIRNKYNLFSS